jgi:hypothetical protein
MARWAARMPAPSLSKLRISRRLSQQGDHVEVALHHHGPVVAADGVGGPIQPEQVLALLEHLRFRGVEVFRLGPVQPPATEADHPALAVTDRHHHPVAEAVVEAAASLPGHHQAGRLQQIGTEALHLLQVLQQAVPAGRGIAELEGLEGGLGEAALPAQVGEGRRPLRSAQLGLEPARRQGQHPVQTVAAGELLPQPLLLGTVEGLDRQLVLAGQIQHHLAEAGALQLHQELDGVAAGAAGEAVIELFGGRHRHRRGCVVVEGADADEFPALLLEHHVLPHHIDDVGPFLDGLDRAGVETGKAQGCWFWGRPTPGLGPGPAPLWGMAPGLGGGGGRHRRLPGWGARPAGP